jgi:hypothetical protein
LFASAVARIPGFLRQGFIDRRRMSTRIVSRILDSLATKPTAGWALRRGQLVHGAATPADYLDALRDYSLEGRAGAIRCPTFVCNAEDDDIGASAPQLVAELTCPHSFMTFASADGAGDHCEAGARSLFHAEAFGWLDALLRPTA